MYFCFTTTLTVGYGDFNPEQSTRAQLEPRMPRRSTESDSLATNQHAFSLFSGAVAAAGSEHKPAMMVCTIVYVVVGVGLIGACLGMVVGDAAERVQAVQATPQTCNPA